MSVGLDDILMNANEAEADLDQVMGREQVFSKGYFEGCHFRDCHFQNACFDRCDFENCIFENCELDKVGFSGSSLRDVRFMQCRMMGVDWSNLGTHAMNDITKMSAIVSIFFV